MNLVAALFAVDPSGLGGVVLRAPVGQPRDDWLALLKKLLPAGTAQRRIPLNISDAALLGGLDLGATLAAGRPVAQRGVLAHADGGIVTLAMAERMSLSSAARIAAVLDTQEVAIERDGLALKLPARIGVVALDEGLADDEAVPAALLDRLAFWLQLNEQPLNAQPLDAQRIDDGLGHWTTEDIAQARALLPSVTVADSAVRALCAAALALGVNSLRAPIFALKTARCAAALDGVRDATPEHIALAARLVLAPRATHCPPAATDGDRKECPANEDPHQDPTHDDDREPEAGPGAIHDREQDHKPDPNPSQQQLPPNTDPAAKTADDNDEKNERDADISRSDTLTESVISAAQAAIPAGLLAAVRVGQAARSGAQAAGRSGALQKSQTRGRPMGTKRGEPRTGARLNVMETLRAAAPWQKLRQRQSKHEFPGQTGTARAPIHVRREDFHVTRFKQQSQTTTLFVVDASGSSALHRLGEAKGAVELLLADCYVRRDSVAVLAFRGKTAELLLAPTRSLARAKRSLAGLPGGGGTPLATAIDAARELASQIRRRGSTPIVVLLTDGRGNIARDGTPGRTQAGADASAAARQLRQAGLTALLLDTSAQPHPAAQALASEMGAAYVPLPNAGAQALSRVVQIAKAAAQ